MCVGVFLTLKIIFLGSTLHDDSVFCYMYSKKMCMVMSRKKRVFNCDTWWLILLIAGHELVWCLSWITVTVSFVSLPWLLFYRSGQACTNSRIFFLNPTQGSTCVCRVHFVLFCLFLAGSTSTYGGGTVREHCLSTWSYSIQICPATSHWRQVRYTPRVLACSERCGTGLATCLWWQVATTGFQVQLLLKRVNFDINL